MKNTQSAKRGPIGPFLKVGLSFGNAGAILRLKDDMFYSVLASWVRTRKGGVDKVFYTTPDQLRGPAEDMVKCITLTGDQQRKRFDLVIEPNVDICNAIETTSEGGSYAAVFMDRVGQSPDFRSMLYKMDKDSWRPDTSNGVSVNRFGAWMDEDFLAVARDLPSAWAIMYAAGSLFGGQDPSELDAVFEQRDDVHAPHLPADLAQAIEDERNFRSRQRRARSMSPEAAAEFRAKLSPDQLAAFDSLIEGKRTHHV